MRNLWTKTFAIGAIILSLAITSAALAEVANRYAGQVILLTKRPPSRWANDAIFYRFIAQHKTGGITEDANKVWNVEYMAFFRSPVGDREVTTRFYDANDRSGRYLTSYTLYLNDPRQRVVGSKVRLERPDFQPNRYYKVTVASRGRTLAQLNKFALIGEEPERSGVVDFTEDE
jgi:hypothetical protein